MVSVKTDTSKVIFKQKHFELNTNGLSANNNIETKVKLRPIFQLGGIGFMEDIKFDIFDGKLSRESLIILDNIVQLMENHNDLTLEVKGYASCNLTTEDANSLSVERAKAVVWFLTGSNVDYKRISALAWGKLKPITKCKCEDIKTKDKPCTKKDHLKNSRVKIIFTENKS